MGFYNSPHPALHPTSIDPCICTSTLTHSRSLHPPSPLRRIGLFFVEEKRALIRSHPRVNLHILPRLAAFCHSLFNSPHPPLFIIPSALPRYWTPGSFIKHSCLFWFMFITRCDLLFCVHFDCIFQLFLSRSPLTGLRRKDIFEKTLEHYRDVSVNFIISVFQLNRI